MGASPHAARGRRPRRACARLRPPRVQVVARELRFQLSPTHVLAGKAIVELDTGHSGATEVVLLSSKRTRRVAVKFSDEATGKSVELTLLPTDDPLDVFNHPYASAACSRPSRRKLAGGQRSR